jgi:hypothetical protein
VAIPMLKKLDVKKSDLVSNNANKPGGLFTTPTKTTLCCIDGSGEICPATRQVD